MRLGSAVIAAATLAAGLLVSTGPASAVASPGVSPALATAIERDLGITPAEYLARAQRAADLGAWRDAVEQATPGAVADVSIEDGVPHVTFSDPVVAQRYSAALAPSQAPALPGGSFAMPTLPAPSDLVGPITDGIIDLALRLPGVTDPNGPAVLGGDAFVVRGAHQAASCSVGFPVITPDGTPGFVTAGHCDRDGRAAGTPAASMAFDGAGTVVGRFTKVRSDGMDYSVVRAVPQVAHRLSIDGTRGAGGAAVPVRGTLDPIRGMDVCTTGFVTGFSCGKVLATGLSEDVEGVPLHGMFTVSTCVQHGDSGGAVVAGDRVVGIINATDALNGCAASPRPTALSTPASAILADNPGMSLRVAR